MYLFENREYKGTACSNQPRKAFQVFNIEKRATSSLKFSISFRKR